MVASIQSFASNIYEVLPAIPKYRLSTPSEIISKAQQVALPALALLAVTHAAQGAEAIGTLGCIICLAGGGGLLCIPICTLALVTIPVQAF